MINKLEEIDKMEEASRFADEKFDKYCRYCEHYVEGEGTDKEVCYECQPTNIKEIRRDKPYVGVEGFSPNDELIRIYGVEVSGINEDDEIVVNIDSFIKQFKDGCYEYIDEEVDESSE